jgi:hypothetical protein
MTILSDIFKTYKNTNSFYDNIYNYLENYICHNEVSQNEMIKNKLNESSKGLLKGDQLIFILDNINIDIRKKHIYIIINYKDIKYNRSMYILNNFVLYNKKYKEKTNLLYKINHKYLLDFYIKNPTDSYKILKHFCKLYCSNFIANFSINRNMWIYIITYIANI